MKKLTPIEWQSFSLKKDIEIIVKKLRDDNVIQFSLLGEIALVVLGVSLSNIFVDIAKQRYFWIILTVLSIIPFIILALRWFCEKRKENKPGSDQMAPRVFIDAFDNEIAYYILMSESYYTMLIEALSYNKNNSADKIPQNMIHFYYIQVSYYFQKTIADLAPLRNITDKVLSFKEDEIITRRLIVVPRYNNVKNLLTTIFNYLESHKTIMGDLDEGDLILDLNKAFMDILNSIDEAVSASLKELEK